MSQTTGIQFLDESIPTLQKWTNLRNGYKVVYDSKVDGCSENKIFNQKVMNIPNIVIVNIDSNGVFFGCFAKKPLTYDNGCNEDVDHFIFALNGNHSEPMKWAMKTVNIGGVKLIRNDDVLYEVGNYEGYVEIHKIGLDSSKCNMLGLVYSDMADIDLNGTNGIRKQTFGIQRIVAFQLL
ncbi:hypothetical protein QTN25_003008 [Entamoeba marina]